MTIRALGIFREALHSPDREFDDSEILKLTREHLAGEGWEISLQTPDEAMRNRMVVQDTLPDLLFIMCEQEKILHMIRQVSEKTTVVNSIASILSTYRNKMVPMLQSSHVPLPESDLVSTEAAPSPESGVFSKIWVKRGDVHNTTKQDVVLCDSLHQVQTVLRAFAARDIRWAVLQKHVEGDLVKFYGVGSSNDSEKDDWFKWFYHKDQTLKKHIFSESSLREIAQNAARCLGLEIYGGDAVVGSDGEIFLIDINAWPSFALFRKEASRVIASYLISRMTKKVQKI